MISCLEDFFRKVFSYLVETPCRTLVLTSCSDIYFKVESLMILCKIGMTEEGCIFLIFDGLTYTILCG